ncbi:MAG: GW dipeptide domain-containing protein [Minisyncoccia bacterium]
MADKPDAKEEIKDEISEMIWILLAVFLAFYFLSLLVTAVNSSKLLSLGWRAFTPQGLLISKTRPISSLINPINSKFVVTINEAVLYDSPGGKKIDTKKLGDSGRIVGGPVTLGTDKYWNVRFDDGSTGWILESDIASLPQGVTPMKDMPTLISSEVEIFKESPVFSEPGVSQIAIKKVGEHGTIIEGSIIKDNIKYWHIRFDDGTVGWVDEQNLNSLKVEKQSMREATDQIGGRVAVSNGPSDVFEEPGERRVGTVLIGVRGTVLDGQREANGVKYWRVRFDDGVTGWVAEDNLDYLRVTKTPLSQMPSLIGGKVIVSRNSAPIYDRPGGKVIFTKSKNAVGRVVEGPLVFDGKKYWHIKLDDGSEGWMLEDDINYSEDIEPSFLERLITFFITTVGILKYIIILFSLALVGFIVYLYRGLSSLRIKEKEALYTEGQLENVEDKRIINPSWERVLDYIESFNESDWRLSIIEADIMLGDLLDKLSVGGDSIGEKLKLIEKSDFTTIENAWEAHKIRNRIAHDGGDFLLTQREARRVIDLYRSIFDEFEMI